MRVTDNLNHLLPNAPVTFTVTQGGTLQATASGTIAAALTVKTNAYGRAIVYFQLPNTPNAQFQIAARPATGGYSNSVLFVENSDAGSGSHGTPTLPPDNPQGGGGNPPANNPPQIPVQYYAALDISGNNTDGENVTSVALDDNNHAAFAYMESGGHLIAKKWANGAVDSSFSNQTPMPDTVTLSLTWGRESMDYDFDRTLEYNYCVNASGTIYGTVLYRPKDNGPTEFGLGMTFTDSTAMPIDLFNSLTLLGYNEMAHDDEKLVVLGCSANTYYGFTFHSGLWPDMGYVSKSGITTLFVANNCPWNPQESDTLKINYADGWFYPFMASDNGWAAGERSQGGLWGGAMTPAVWNANQEKVTDLGENNWPVGVNNQGYVLCGGSSGSNKATLWHADSSTDLKDLLPADYKSMLDSIKPKLISNADSGNAVNILFNATEIASGAAHDYVLQALTSGTNTLAQISLPDGVNADFHSLNASGIISSIGTPTTGTNASASTSAKKAILLLPVEMRITDRDDPKKKWSDNVLKTAPVYSGKSTGDMVSWKLGGTDSWTNATFSWSAKGPETKTGPSGIGKNEWKIANGDEDTQHDWVDWKPGKYKIKCAISFGSGGSSTIELDQEIGVRTDDVVIVGWIDPAQVPLNSSGVQSALTQVFPPGGLTSGDSGEAKAKAAQLLNIIATEGVNFTFEIGPGGSPSSFTPFSATDKTYALNWMFKYAGNRPPPSGFTESDGFFSQQELDDFATRENHTLYKLLNHYQAKYRVGDDHKFNPGTLVHLKHEVQIGYTKDPSRYYEVTGIIAWIGRWVNSYPAGGAFPGTAGPNNSLTPVTKDTESKLCNEGRPDRKALDAFRQLTGQDQGQIWSSITFFSDLQYYSETTSSTSGQSLTRAPKPQYFYQGRINTQVYPTYWMYINGKKDAVVQNQAPSPSALFPNTDKCQ